MDVIHALPVVRCMSILQMIMNALQRLQQRVPPKVMSFVACLWIVPPVCSGADFKALPPEQALAAIVVEPGLKLELVAAEPLTADPVAVAWDERGRLFVAENRGYPTGPGTNQPPAGVIAMLEDADRDGRMDKRTEFATGLNYPNGLMPWRGGFFVTDAPDIYYLKDTNGDGRADVRKVVLTGFMTNSTTQLRVSHPTLGLDGWVYLTAGLTGGNVTSPEHPERPAVKFTKSDSRFHPDTFEIEPEPGQGQFGLAFDDFGRRFIVSNRNPLMHVVLHPRYLKRNPHLAFSDTVENVSPFGDEAKVWPLSEDQTTAAFHPTLMSTPHAGTFTSACGISIYRGSALPPAMYGNAFICEPAQNLVQRQVIEPDGPTFKSRLATPGRESIATRDPWFRPVFTANGPDGALYVCDMYRKVLDHPQYMPEYMRHTLDYEAGKGMGRIYRLTAEKGTKTKGQRPNLAKASNRKLIDSLKADDAWTRDTVFRLLLERNDSASFSALQRLAKSEKETPQSKVAALRLLATLQTDVNDVVMAARQDRQPEVREHAILLSEQQSGASQPIVLPLSPELLVLNGERLPRLRFLQVLAYQPSEFRHQSFFLPETLIAYGTNRWMRAATLSAVGTQVESFVEAFLKHQLILKIQGEPTEDPEEKKARAFSKLLKVIGGATGVDASKVKSKDMIPAMLEVGQMAATGIEPVLLPRYLAMATSVDTSEDRTWQMAFVTGLANGARSRGLAKGGKSALLNLVSGDSPEAKQAAARLSELFGEARRMAVNASLSGAERVSAIELLGHGEFAQSGEALQGLLNLQTPDEVQVAAVRALAQMPDDSVAKTFITKWREYTPAVRDAVLGALLSQTRFLPSLLDALEQGVVQAWAIPNARKNQLLKNRDQGIRTRAEKAFASQGGDRMKVYESLKPVASTKGMAASGHAIFTKTCASCHRYNGEGAQVGPDLTGVRNQPAEALLLHIIVPNAEIYPGFSAYEAETRDGRSITGILASETPTSVTIRAAQGIEETILRSNLSRFAATSLSLMPDELEKTMSKQELADLLAFLKGE